MATIMIGSARHDENGKYVNGSAGDSLQTSSTNDTIGEVSMQNFYVHSKGWYIIRPKSIAHADSIASTMKGACNNKQIGYDQNGRLGIITYGTKTTTKTECDCGTLVRQCVKEATGKDPGNFTTADAPTKLDATGLFEDKIVYVSQEKTPIYNGDILCTKIKGHIVIVVSGNPRVATTATTVTTTTSSNSKKDIIKKGQQHAIDFTGVKIDVDGIVGTQTKKMKARVLQHGMNLDYGKTIEEDGAFGTKSKAKLGNHYVMKGEKQYMVSALEILMELNGIDPNGVEYPGHYGNGLVNASKQFFGDDGLKVTASEFLKLL